MFVFFIMPATQPWVMTKIVSLLVLILAGVLFGVTLIALVTDIASLCHLYYTYTCLHVVVVSEVATVYKPVMFAQIVSLLFLVVYFLISSQYSHLLCWKNKLFRGLVVGKLTYDAISSCWSSDISKVRAKTCRAVCDGIRWFSSQGTAKSARWTTSVPASRIDFNLLIRYFNSHSSAVLFILIS